MVCMGGGRERRAAAKGAGGGWPPWHGGQMVQHAAQQHQNAALPGQQQRDKAGTAAAPTASPSSPVTPLPSSSRLLPPFRGTARTRQLVMAVARAHTHTRAWPGRISKQLTGAQRNDPGMARWLGGGHRAAGQAELGQRLRSHSRTPLPPVNSGGERKTSTRAPLQGRLTGGGNVSAGATQASLQQGMRTKPHCCNKRHRKLP
jgi:hypothetical protein